jgi:phage terminase small subunit
MFCCWFVKLGDVAEAAVRAGYPKESAFEEGMHLLRQNRYRSLVRQIYTIFSQNMQEHVLSGLERLAFGNTQDAVRLVLADSPPTEEVLARMNLYNIAEIKRDKGGGVEVKFADRQKALEKMMEYAGDADQRAAAKSLLHAIAGADDDGI